MMDEDEGEGEDVGEESEGFADDTFAQEEGPSLDPDGNEVTLSDEDAAEAAAAGMVDAEDEEEEEEEEHGMNGGEDEEEDEDEMMREGEFITFNCACVHEGEGEGGLMIMIQRDHHHRSRVIYERSRRWHPGRSRHINPAVEWLLFATRRQYTTGSLTGLNRTRSHCIFSN